ncbi:MAG: hypothetical protein Q4C39_05050 [Clostridia bacterium]|nr:hypothetical protein [Clostridia bacterium]
MKKQFLKFRIIMTNISRIIMSFLFVNLSFSLANRVLGFEPINKEIIATCYAAGPDEKTFTLNNVLIILVPVAIIIGVVIFIIKKKKNKTKEEKRDVEKG